MLVCELRFQWIVEGPGLRPSAYRYGPEEKKSLAYSWLQRKAECREEHRVTDLRLTPNPGIANSVPLEEDHFNS